MLYDSEAFKNVFNALEPSAPASLQLFKFISSSVNLFCLFLHCFFLEIVLSLVSI